MILRSRGSGIEVSWGCASDGMCVETCEEQGSVLNRWARSATSDTNDPREKSLVRLESLIPIYFKVPPIPVPSSVLYLTVGFLPNARSGICELLLLNMFFPFYFFSFSLQ